MTGPEHFREAERLLVKAVKFNDPGLDMQLAQVHATLALAAATALYDADFDDGQDVEAQAWRTVAGQVTP
jgi:hypothetical protein